MKKIIVFILLLSFTFSLSGIQVIAESESGYTFYADFVSKAPTVGWKLTGAALKNDTLVLAENSSANNGSVAATAVYDAKKMGENMAFEVSLDVKPGRNMTVIVQVDGKNGIIVPVLFDKSGEICVNSYGVSDEKSRTYRIYEPDKWYHVRAVIDQTSERLKTVVYDKDSGEIVAEKQIIGYSFSGKTPISGGIKTVTLQANMGNNSDYTPVIFDYIKITEIPIGYSVYTDATGNNFGHDGTDDIHYRFMNNSKEDYECELEWEIYEDDLGFIKNGIEKFSIDKSSEKEIVIKTDMGRYGLYKISAKLCYLDGNEKIDTGNDSDLYFSKVLSSDKGEFSDRIGFASHSSLGYYDENMKLMEMIGCTGTRAGLLSWNAVQNKEGVFDYSFNKDAVDTWKISAMPANVFMLGYGNKSFVEQVDFTGKPAEPNFYRPPRTKEEIERFGDYVEYVIDRVGDCVDYYEVWNEFSGSIYSNVYGGALLADICREVKKRVEKRDPTAKVIGLAGVNIYEIGFIKEFFDAGGYDCCDAFSLHPYNSATGDIFPSDHWKDHVEQEIELIKSYGPMKPIFYTEIGWSAAWESTNEAVKARAIVKVNVFTLAHDMASKIYVHNIQNIGLDPNEREHQFAVLTASGDYRGDRHALPGFVVTAAMNKFLPGKIVCEGMVEKDSRLVAAYNIKREDGKNVAVMWATTVKNADVSLDLGCQSVDTYDEYGNFIETVYSETGKFDFGLSDKVMYAIGEFTKFEECETVITHKDAEYISTLNDVTTVRICDSLGRNGSIELEYNHDATELLSECIMKDGKAEISLKTNSTKMGEYPMNIKAFDESGRCIYVSQNTLKIDEPVSVEARAVNYFNLDSRWGIELNIRNNANTVAVRGKAKITAPDDFKSKCKTVIVPEIAPQTTEAVYINLPEMIKKRTVTVGGTVELDYGYTVDFSQYLDFTAAYYAEKPPKIDGKIDDNEWIGTAMAATDEDNWTSLIKTDPWRGANDNSLESLKIMWDEDKLYLAAVVRDDVMVKTPSKMEGNATGSSDPAFYLWRYDSIQFGIEDEYFNVPNRLNYPFTEIGLALGEEGPFVYRFSGQTEMPVGVLENAEIAITVQNDEAIYECAIPWSEIRNKDYKPDENLIYAFAALVNDNDGGGRKGYTMYNDGIGGTKKVEKFGQMKLKR